MEKTKQTRELLADRFHELMLAKDFEKITIKQITDAAGVIRPTFYYHFPDKYDVLEYILCRDIIDPVRNGCQDSETAIRESFRQLEKDRQFYKRAFRVTGQNSFEEMLIRQLNAVWTEALEEYGMTAFSNRLLNRTTMARYYALQMATIIRLWIVENITEATAEEMYEAYVFLMSHSIYDVFRGIRTDSFKRAGSDE